MKKSILFLGAPLMIAPITLIASCANQVQTVTVRPITDEVVKEFINKQWPGWWKESYRLTVEWKNFFDDKKDFNIEGIHRVLIEDMNYPDDEQNQRKIVNLELIPPELDIAKQWYWDGTYGFRSPFTPKMAYEWNNYYGTGRPIMWIQSKV